jgi:hypothetical protein
MIPSSSTESSRARGFEKSGARSQESEEESRIALKYALQATDFRQGIQKLLCCAVTQIVGKKSEKEILRSD